VNFRSSQGLGRFEKNNFPSGFGLGGTTGPSPLHFISGVYLYRKLKPIFMSAFECIGDMTFNIVAMQQLLPSSTHSGHRGVLGSCSVHCPNRSFRCIHECVDSARFQPRKDVLHKYVDRFYAFQSGNTCFILFFPSEIFPEKNALIPFRFR